MSKRSASNSTSTGPSFPPLGLVAGLGAPGSLNGSLPSSYPNSRSLPPSSDAATTANGLPPAPNKFDVSQAQQCRLQDAYWSDEEEDMDCPLCLEEIDLSDANFKPCPCGYQICRFCWHHIKQNLNGRCPACRRKYSDQTVEFKPMTSDEIKKLTQAKKQKEREKKELESMNRKHLANMRVVQKNLVYVVGLSSKLAKEELIPTLRSDEYFGQYGRISKILISKRNTASKLVMGTSETALGVYVTYHRKEDAAKAIVAIDGSKESDGRIIRASYGTTKYCTTYLRNLPCSNPGCTYLHEPGEEADSFTKEDLSTLRHAAKDTEHKIKPASLSLAQSIKRADLVDALDPESSALPKTASWASGKPSSQAASAMAGNSFRENDMPPLSASLASALSRKTSSQKPSTPRAAKQMSSSSSKAKLAAMAGRSGSPAPVDTDTLNVSEPASPTLSKADLPASLESTSQDQRSAQTEEGALSSAKIEAKVDAKQDADEETERSTYQPSSSAQALLDDMLQRREAQPAEVKPSPFPDFDDALSSFQDGDFSFNLPASQQLTMDDGPSDLYGAFSNFNPFGAPSGMYAAHSGLVTAGTPPPGIVRTPNRSSTASPAPLCYSGSFDPFAPGAGESIKEDGSAFSEAAHQASPFATLEHMRRTFSQDQAIAQNNLDDSTEEGKEISKRASRFDFAKRKESESFIAASPLRTELMGDRQIKGNNDVFGNGHNDGTNMLGGGFEHDGASRLNAFNDAGAPPGFGLGRDSNAFPGIGLARPPGIAGPGFGGRYGTNTPPPGIAAPASRQQQALLASLHQMGAGSLAGPTEQQHGSINGNHGNFMADQRNQQQQGHFGPSSGEHGDQGRSNSSTTSSDPLLAQLLAASGRRTGFGGQPGSGSELNFNDPAIMSMTRAQMQAAQQQQQQQQQQQPQHQFGGGRFGPGSGFGGGSGFAPFDQGNGGGSVGSGSGNAFSPGLYGGDQRFSMQQNQGQNQGQQDQHDLRNPYPAMS